MHILLAQSAAQNPLLCSGLRPGQTDLFTGRVFWSLYSKYQGVIIVRDSDM